MTFSKGPMRYEQGMISDDLVFKSLSPNAAIKIPTYPPQNFEIQIMFRVIVFNFYVQPAISLDLRGRCQPVVPDIGINKSKTVTLYCCQ